MPETTASGKQIRAGSIDNTHIKAGAAIALNKLAETVLKADGTQALTGNQSAGGFKFTNLGTPTPGSTDAARQVDIDNAVISLSSVFKNRSARVASTANVNTANPGTATFDGVTLANGDRILLKDQTTQSQNGIWVFNGSGVPMTRASDADSWAEFPAQFVTVTEGSQASALGYADFRCLADDGGTLGTTAIVYTPSNSNGLTNANFVDKETPSGTINGLNTAFSLSFTPVAGSEHLYLNGVLQRSGSGNDYTISGTAITFTTAPVSGDILLCSYRK